MTGYGQQHAATWIQPSAPFMQGIQISLNVFEYLEGHQQPELTGPVCTWVIKKPDVTSSLTCQRVRYDASRCRHLEAATMKAARIQFVQQHACTRSDLQYFAGVNR